MTRSVPGADLGKGQQEEMRVKGGPQSITSQISIRVGGAKREAMFWSLGRRVCGLVGLLDATVLKVGGVGMLGGEGTSGARQGHEARGER
jgi:hypothetical protein